MMHRRHLLLAAALSAGSAALAGTARSEAGPMRIGVIGAGSLGGTVGRAWVEAGHEVLFSSRHPEELAAMAARMGSRASVGTTREAAAFGPAVLVAVPYDAMPALGAELGDVLRGKVVLDATNPAPGSDNALARETRANGIGPTSARLLPGTRLVRAFSAVDATAVAASVRRQADRLAVPLAGNDAEAVQVAARLVRDAGCEPLVVGNLGDTRGFERGGAAFRANAGLPELRRLLGIAVGR